MPPATTGGGRRRYGSGASRRCCATRGHDAIRVGDIRLRRASDVEIAAPGVDIESTWNDGGYNTISGTSMASPHVAGTIALCLASGVCSGSAEQPGDTPTAGSGRPEPGAGTAATQGAAPGSTEEDGLRIEIGVGDQRFEASLDDSAASREVEIAKLVEAIEAKKKVLAERAQTVDERLGEEDPGAPRQGPDLGAEAEDRDQAPATSSFAKSMKGRGS